MKTNITKIITILSIVLSNFAFGQYNQYVEHVKQYVKGPNHHGFFYYQAPNNFSPGEVYQNFKQEVNDFDNNMVLHEDHVDPNGSEHFDYQQIYKNLPVEAAGYIEHFDSTGTLKMINAKFANNINQNPTPALSDEEAISSLIHRIQMDYETEGELVKFAWQDSTLEHQKQINNNDSTATWYPEAKLMWAIDNFKDVGLIISGERYTLAYKIPVTIISPQPKRIIYFVNSQTGEILKKVPTIINCNPDIKAGVYSYGTGHGLDAEWHGGLFNKGYILVAKDCGHNIHTKKYESQSVNDWGNTPEIRKKEFHWNNTYLTETSTHYHVTNSWDYFYNTYQRKGIDGHGIELRVLTQIPAVNAGYDYDNLYGDDVISFGHSPNNIDLGKEPAIVGHEYVHGITHYASHLGNKHEPGAVNESYSDIFGIVIQSLTLEQGYTDWIIGNRIPSTDMFERSLKNPNTRGYHWSGQYDGNGDAIYDLGQPEYYHGMNWCNNCPSNVDDGGVHINGGVQNKWFQVLTEGNDEVQGIGMKKAAKIAYFALIDNITQSSNYQDSKESTIASAIDNFGNCSAEHKSVVDAWNYVGVNASYDCDNMAVKTFDMNNISIYPNPTSSDITIELPHILKEPVLIYDVNGRFIDSFKGEGLFFKRDLSSLQKGMYFLHFIIENQTVVKRIIVQ